MRIIYILLALFLFQACNSGNSNETANSSQDPQVNLNDEIYPLPEVSNLITPEQIEKALNLHGGAMYETKSNSTDRSKSTFFKLDDPEKGNAAIVIQVKSNPLPEEFPDWDIGFIQGIKETGEQRIKSEEEPYKYEILDIGIEGVGNRELGKYLWRDEHRHVYMLAFNVTKTPDEIHDAALKIAEIVDSNY